MRALWGGSRARPREDPQRYKPRLSAAAGQSPAPQPRPSIGVITFELRIDDAHSLKDKRHYVKSLKDRLRAKFNVAVAEIGDQDVWQR